MRKNEYIVKKTGEIRVERTRGRDKPKDQRMEVIGKDMTASGMGEGKVRDREEWRERIRV